MTPLWTPPFPRMGGKRRYATQIAARYELLKPETIYIPYAGLAGELAAYTGDAKIVIAEKDPAIRAVWECAGCEYPSLDFARDRAIFEWSLTKGDQETYRAIRDSERLNWSERRYYASWALIMGGLAISGLWRRNKKGEFNVSMPPQWGPEMLEKRLPSAEAMRAADAWASEREIVVLEEAHQCLRLALQDAIEGKNIAVIIDPPFGSEAGKVYGADWTRADAMMLMTTTRELLAFGADVVAWAADSEVGTWEFYCHQYGEFVECKKSKRRTGARTSKPYWMMRTKNEQLQEAA